MPSTDKTQPLTGPEMVERVARAICETEIGGELPGSLDDTGEKSAAHWRDCRESSRHRRLQRDPRA